MYYSWSANVCLRKWSLHISHIIPDVVLIWCVYVLGDQSEVGSIDCEIQPEKGMYFYGFENLSIAIPLEPLIRFRWGFQQNVRLPIKW